VWDLSGQCPVSQQADEREQEALAFTVGQKVEAAQNRGRFDLVPAARIALISEPLPDTERGVDQVLALCRVGVDRPGQFIGQSHGDDSLRGHLDGDYGRRPALAERNELGTESAAFLAHALVVGRRPRKLLLAEEQGPVFGLDAQVVLEQEVVQLQQVERVRLQVVHTTHLADQILVAVELAIQDAATRYSDRS